MIGKLVRILNGERKAIIYTIDDKNSADLTKLKEEMGKIVQLVG